MSVDSNPFRINSPLRHVPAIGPFVHDLAERALAFERLANIYRQVAAVPSTPADFAARALGSLGVRFAVDPAQLERLPSSGPAVVVANHPFGGIEGLFLISLLLRVRSDTRLIANKLLNRIPEIRDSIIPVDAFGGPRAARENVRALRQALAHVHGGGMIALFPAGIVSHLHLSAGRVCDPAWSDSAARLIKLCRAPVIPIHFGGSNSAVFQTLGLLHPRMRTALLSRELLKRRPRQIPVTIGRSIEPARVAEHEDDTRLASFLRLSTYALEARSTVHRLRERSLSSIDAPIPARLLEAEIDHLSAMSA
jgi:putative hemolysin